jgi:hypothetical protein
MRQRPDAVEFDRLADRILGDAPLPEDRKALSYDQRMALKARSIAEFDRARGNTDTEEELALFAILYGEDQDRSVEELNRRLAGEIRAGKWDDAPAALQALLIQQVSARLERSNPKYLKAMLGE